MNLAARRVDYRIDRQYAMLMKQLARTLEIPIEIIRDIMRRLVKPLTIVSPIWEDDYFRGLFTAYAPGIAPNGGPDVQSYENHRILLRYDAQTFWDPLKGWQTEAGLLYFLTPRWFLNSSD